MKRVFLRKSNSNYVSDMFFFVSDGILMKFFQGFFWSWKLSVKFKWLNMIAILLKDPFKSHIEIPTSQPENIRKVNASHKTSSKKIGAIHGPTVKKHLSSDYVGLIGFDERWKTVYSVLGFQVRFSGHPNFRYFGFGRLSSPNQICCWLDLCPKNSEI